MLLSGCGGEKKVGDTNAAPEESKGPSAEVGPEEAGLSWQKDTSPISFTCYIDYDWYALDAWGEEDVSQEITKRTGVSLEVTKASDTTQLQVLLAADELPEIVFTANQVQRFENPDISYSFDELIEKHCPEFMDMIDPIEIVNNTADDGHFYTLKSHYNNEEAWADPRNLPSPGSAGFYVREDILQGNRQPGRHIAGKASERVQFTSKEFKTL